MSESTPAPPPVEVFVSYSREDEAYCHKVIEQLKILKHDGVIATWHDRMIPAGDDWARHIDERLDSAGIILLLVSPSSLASDFIRNVEMPRALQRLGEGKVRVIPVIVRVCQWQKTALAKLNVLPRDGKPVGRWDDPDEAYLQIAEGVEAVAADIARERFSQLPPAEQARLRQESQEGQESPVGQQRQREPQAELVFACDPPPAFDVLEQLAGGDVIPSEVRSRLAGTVYDYLRPGRVMGQERLFVIDRDGGGAFVDAYPFLDPPSPIRRQKQVRVPNAGDGVAHYEYSPRGGGSRPRLRVSLWPGPPVRVRIEDPGSVPAPSLIFELQD